MGEGVTTCFFLFIVPFTFAFPTFFQIHQEFQMKMESLQQRREELDRKEYQLKESLLKFDKFLKVCS